MRIRKFILTILGLTLFFPTFSFCQGENIKFETTKLSEHAYILTRTWDSPGERANMGVIIGEEGLLLINPSFYGEEVDQFMKEFQKISDKPIKYVINSNWDEYNTVTNKYFKDKDVLIISHKNVGYQGNIYTQLTFKEKFSLNLGTESIIAYRSFGHSFGHINIHLVNANATFMSDSFRNNWMTIEGPFGLYGHLEGIDKALAMGNQNTKYIPGNTGSKIISDTDDLIKEKKLRLMFSNRVLELKKLGKSNKEILMDAQIIAIFNQYELYQYIKEEIGDWIISPVLFEEKAKSHILSLEQLEKYVGTYYLEGKKDVEIFIEDGELFSKSIGQFYLKLVSTSDTHFWYDSQYLSAYQIFKLDDKNNVIGFTIENNGEPLIYTKNQ